MRGGQHYRPQTNTFCAPSNHIQTGVLLTRFSDGFKSGVYEHGWWFLWLDE